MTKKRKRAKKSGKNTSSAYETLPYYYPTEQVKNLDKLQRKKKYHQ
jgi:hypothetical protein